MKCNHCDLCCKDPLTQISLTIGDIWRIADFLKIDIKELFKEYIGMTPFREPEFEDIYDIDLGLNLPCKFNINNKCIIYPIMPLNCKLFPEWILGNLPNENIKEALKEHKCDYNLDKKQEYKNYADKIGEILLEESKFYRLFKKINTKGLFEINGKDLREKENNRVQKLREMFKDHLKIEDIKKAIDENLDKIKENKIKLEEIEKCQKK